MSTSIQSNRGDNKRPKTSENNYVPSYGSKYQSSNQNNGRNTVMNGSYQNNVQSDQSNPFINSLKVPSDNDQGYIKY